MDVRGHLHGGQGDDHPDLGVGQPAPRGAAEHRRTVQVLRCRARQPNELAHQADTPAFTANPADTAVLPTSHIRRANPRAQATDADRRIFRRGYPLIIANPNGTLQRGLLFIAFGRTLSTQVDFIMKAWLKNPNFPVPGAGIDPLLNLEVQASQGISQVIAGGYYFVPPLNDPEQPWSWKLS